MGYIPPLFLGTLKCLKILIINGINHKTKGINTIK